MSADYNSYAIPGEAPNRHDDRSPTLLVTTWVLLGISSAVLAARLWSKASNTRRLYFDDVLMVLALVFGYLHGALTTTAIHYGLGRHIQYLPHSEMVNAMLYGIVSLAWGNLSPMVGRIAFCVTMLFLTKTDARVRKWPIWLFIGGQLLVNLTAVIFFYSQCGSHLNAMTTANYELIPLYCLDPRYQTDFGYFAGSFNCLTDAFLTILPAILINHTRLSVKKKIGLAFLLCLSVLALCAAIVKTFEAKWLSQVTDYTYDLCSYVIWMSIELNVVIIVASIPLLRPLFQRRTQPQQHWEDPALQWDTLTLRSGTSKKGLRSSTVLHHHSSSEDHIMTPRPQYELTAMPAIQVTREVSVSYESSDAPFVHAALVGLIQGEIANPHLVRR